MINETEMEKSWARYVLIGVPILAFIGILALAIGSSGDDEAALTGAWELTEIHVDGSMTAVLESTSPTLVIDETEVSGSGGCNTYGGSISIDGDTLRFGPLVSTLMFCADPEGVSDQEAAYLSLLDQVDTFEVTDDRLTLRIATDPALIFVRA